MFAALFCAPALAHAARPDPRGGSLVRIEVDTTSTIASLQAAGIEPWPDHPRPPRVLARVPADARAWLDASGLSYEIVVPDLEVSIEIERQRLAERTPAAGTPAVFDDFRDLDEIGAHMDALALLDPGLVTPVQIGTSIEGRPIRGLRIERAGDTAKPLVVVDATQHAREWIAAMSALFVADALVTTAQTDAAIDALLDEVAILVVPVVNPDGYVYTWEDDRFWRKNRRDEHGVDLNRNFPVAWGGAGSSDDPDDGNYHGAAPLSEPEAMALAGLVDTEPTLVGALDVHSFGQLVLSPWSFTHDPPPAADVLAPLGEAIAEWMGQPWHTEYTPQQAAELYLAAGTWPDLAYGSAGAWAYTLELRPEDAEVVTDGFLQPPEAIVECGEEVLAALVAFGGHVADAGPLEPGDDGDAPGPIGPGLGTTGDQGDDGAATGDAISTSSAPDPAESSTAGVDTGSGSDTGGTDPVADREEGSHIDAVSSSCACRSGPVGGRASWAPWALLALLAPRRRSR